MPDQAVWISLGGDGGVLFARDLGRRDRQVALPNEWAGLWHHAWQAVRRYDGTEGLTRKMANNGGSQRRWC